MEEDNKTIGQLLRKRPLELETLASSWKHLAPKPGSWRRQYYLKDRT